jgi:hypothetical protein
MQHTMRAAGLLLLFIPPVSGHGAEGASPAAANAFNPAISLILSGGYAHLSQDPANYAISGFIHGDDVGPGERGFSLGESELVVSANIDPFLYGSLILALAPDNSVSVEEAYVQTIGLSNGLTFKAGRYFSAIGYLNDKHAHTWDFVHNPLAYQAFLGTQFNDDGVQLKWLAPTDHYIELGVEGGRGANFPGSERNVNGAGAQAAFVHTGGDVGSSHSWRAGLSFLKTSPQDREYRADDLLGQPVSNTFTGASRLWIADFLWKWAPLGNPRVRNVTLQGEYFSRREEGVLVYDTAAPAASLGPVGSVYATQQSGWYVQSLYQFMPRWRVGARTEKLHSGTQDLGVNTAYLPVAQHQPTRNSLVLERAFSEFSRVRLQLTRDQARAAVIDNQWFVQYQASLGAHGAHQY